MWRVLAVGVVFLSCAPTAGEQLYAVDFGTVAVGEVHTTTLRLKNNRFVPSRLLRVEQREGARGFTIVPRFEPLAAGDEAEWTVHFDAFQTGRVTARFVAVFERGEAEVSVTALAAERCVVERRLDFGAGPLGDRELTFTFSNDTDEAGNVFAAPLSPPFSSELTGVVALSAHEARDVRVTFNGNTEGFFEQTWRVQPRPDCAPTEVTLLASVHQQPLVATPGRLHFGDAVGQLRVEISNTSNAPIRVTPRIDSPGFRLDDVRDFVVPGRGSLGVIVMRDDRATMPLFGELVLTTSAAHQAELRVPLLARFGHNCVSTAEVRFPAQELACTSPMVTTTLKNDCPHHVRIGAPMTEGPFNLAYVQLGELAAGATTEVGFTFRPTEVGDVLLPQRIPVDVLDHTQELVIGAGGRGLEAPLRDERRVIPRSAPRADVLLVIDDTPAMAVFAQSLSDNIDSLNRFLAGNQLTPRYAVTTTSMLPNEQGRLRLTTTGASWLDEPTSAALMSLVAFRGEQLGGSSCLEAIAAAQFASFRRANASLTVVCITATADDAREPVSQLIARIQNVTPRETNFAIVARFMSSMTCAGTLDSGAMAAFVRHTNGVNEDLCALNWSASLERVGKSAFGYSPTYRLAEQPDLTRAPLRVFFDDVEIPALDPDPALRSRIWRYDGALNAVRFEPIYEPQPGITLRITYAPMCPQ